MSVSQQAYMAAKDLLSCAAYVHLRSSEKEVAFVARHIEKAINASIAAEREKVKRLVDALKDCIEELQSMGAVDGIGDPFEADQDVIDRAKAALAKVKEAK